MEMRTTEGSCGYPVLEVRRIDEQGVRKSATGITRELENGKPSIYVNHKYLQKGVMFIHSVNMDEEIVRIVRERLYAAITA